MLRAMRRGLETGLRRLLTGHKGGNPGYSQGAAYGLPRQFPTLPTPDLRSTTPASDPTTHVTRRIVLDSTQSRMSELVETSFNRIATKIKIKTPDMARITSRSQLISLTAARFFTEPRGRWIFRGHADTHHKLIPSVGRGGHSSRDRSKYERSLFDIFRREACAYLASVPETEWEWLSLAQHHGLP